MLILTRRTQESLRIGDDVTLTILGVKGNMVRIGVTAPKTVPVHREEIYQRILRERQQTGAGVSVWPKASEGDETPAVPAVTG